MVKAYIGAAIKFDSNLYRRSPNATTPQSAGLPAKSDTIFEPQAGLKIDKTVSRQSFGLDLNVFAPRYTNSTQIDYSGWRAAGTWNWAVGNRIAGDIKYADNRGLSGFDDVIAVPDNCPTLVIGDSGNEYVVDLFRDRRFNADANWTLGHNVRLTGSLSRAYNSHDRRACLDQRQDSALVAMTWVSNQGNELSVYGGRTWVEFERDQQTLIMVSSPLGPIPVINTTRADGRGYLQNDVGFEAGWLYSPRTQLSLRWGRSQLEFDGGRRGPATQVGKVGAIWRLSPLTTFNAGYERTLESGTDRAGRNLLDNWSLRIDWAATVKTAFYVDTHYMERDYDAGGSQQGSLAGRRDRDVTLETGLNYHPWPALVMTGWVKYIKRDANVANADYNATLFGVTSRWWF